MNNTYLSPSHLLIEECKRLRKSIQPISSKYEAQRLFSAYNNNTFYPIVLLLGNHSSGKSSFINYLLQRKVQTTGVAPTDDNFTIIGPSNEDIDRNGPALVGDPDLGFSELKTFGPVLVNHTQLKLRSNIAINDFMIVDSPGMIDSPSNKTTAAIAMDSNSPIGIDRGYNFQGVCKWYAERADVILLFFDPDKPGTTGETLSILTTSLVGLDHKMYIILNKADQFKKIHDFARAYGSLCWNLSKVIPRKDLPRIHTMCLPLKSSSMNPIPSSIETNTDLAKDAAITSNENFIVHEKYQSDKVVKTFFEQGIHDLEESRSEVIRETLNAPRRRIDNEISRLTESVNALLMHCTIVDRMIAIYQDKLWRSRGIVFFTTLASIGINIGAHYLCDYLFQQPRKSINYVTPSILVNKQDQELVLKSPLKGDAIIGSTIPHSSLTLDVNNSSLSSSISTKSSTSSFKDFWNLQYSKALVMLCTGMSSITLSIGVTFWQHWTLTSLLKRFQTQSYCEDIYRQLYKQEIADGDESVIGMGKLVLSGLAQVMTPTFVQSSSRVQKLEFHALQRILTEDIATMRRRTSPVFQSLSPTLMTPTRSHDHIVVTDSHTYSHNNLATSILTNTPTPLSPYQQTNINIHGDNNRSMLTMDTTAFSSPLNTSESMQQQQSENEMGFEANYEHLAQSQALSEKSDNSTKKNLSPLSRRKEFVSENKVEDLIAKYNKILSSPGGSSTSSNNRKSFSLVRSSSMNKEEESATSITSSPGRYDSSKAMIQDHENDGENSHRYSVVDKLEPLNQDINEDAVSFKSVSSTED